MSEVLILELLSLPFLPFSTENGLKQILSDEKRITPLMINSILINVTGERNRQALSKWAKTE
jgi:hypothetical protein